MGSRIQSSSDRVYEDFEPFYEWDRDQRLVNVLLPGFRRDQMKVQVTSKSTLRLMGERLITENRWRRFNLELPILSDYDTDNVTAKFEGAKLSIKFGKLSQPRETPQKVEQKKGTQEDGPKEKTNGELSDPKQEQGKTETTDSKDNVPQEAKTNGSSETKEAETSKAPKNRLVSRTKTRLVDFTHSFGPNQVGNQDSNVGKNKWKKLAKSVMLVLLVVALVGYVGLYARNAFTSSSEPEEPYFLEL
ncbi:uncharacterized protein LOC109797912 [Cajanus cajan]|uniref:SHSP domain-containing protein n=1 Tax=Cajanus cajan TaxID=3821 RepID=A0A151TVN0_CAJCA|nr:uncharacterized protein LOC109797912 [Cajanus cajan]KYP71068.1 hypothetical protein KK1_010311 [Cajanus cajan]